MTAAELIEKLKELPLETILFSEDTDVNGEACYSETATFADIVVTAWGSEGPSIPEQHSSKPDIKGVLIK